MNSDFEMSELHQKPPPPPPQQKFMVQNSIPPPSSVYLFPLNPNLNLLQQSNPFQFFQEHHLIEPFSDPMRESNLQSAVSNDNLLHHLSFRVGSCQESQRNCGPGGGGDGGGCPEDYLASGGNRQDGSPDLMTQCWENQEDSALKQRFWMPLSTESPDGNQKESPKETIFEEMRKQQETSEEEPNQETEQNTAKHSFFEGEPEEAAFQWGDINAETTQTTVSGSEDGKGKRKRKRRKSMKDGSGEYASMAEFMERSVKRLMDHQEGLHNKFLEMIERLDRERVGREEARRKEELMNLEREAKARANQRALASSREAAIISYLEKVTGHRISLPPKEPPSHT
ncbi:unnamed protein product [Cuscuta epithymum]|uniref:Uncharacterized protein n=1 Tax=Cuscuta epithymum TaxID=186058 RepID=A0AAV0EWD4_9ASTE|nr:unnamed protein product [Cuscuta epithymum]